MSRKKSGAPRPQGKAKTLPNKSSDTGLIQKEMDKTSLWKKPLPTVDKETNKGDTVS